MAEAAMGLKQPHGLSPRIQRLRDFYFEGVRRPRWARLELDAPEGRLRLAPGGPPGCEVRGPMKGTGRSQACPGSQRGLRPRGVPAWLCLMALLACGGPTTVPGDTGGADRPELMADPGLPPEDPGADLSGDPGANLPDVAGQDLPGDPGGEEPPPAPVPGDFVGICPLDADPAEDHWDRLAGWGVQQVRQGFFWEWITRPDGTFDFSWPDRYLEAAGRRGIRVLIVLDYDHPSIHAPGDPRPFVPAGGMDLWLAYVRAIAGRYGSRAAGFEVWNEPNLPTFWKGTAEEFAALAAATIPVIREEAPGVPIAVAGLSLLPLDWMEVLERQGVLAAADALSFHPYWVDAEGALEMVALAREWLDARGLAMALWVTEYGWPTGGTYPTATSLEGQAERLVRFLPGAAALGVRAAWWYASLDWRDPDQVEDPDASEGFFGIAWPTAGDKPAAEALRVLSEVLPEATPDPRLPERLGLRAPWQGTGFRRPDGTAVLVATNLSGSEATLALPDGFRVLWPPGQSLGGPWALPGDRSLVAAGQAASGTIPVP